MTERPNEVLITSTDYDLVGFVEYLINNHLTISEQVDSEKDAPGARAAPVKSPVAQKIAERILGGSCAHHFAFPEQPKIFRDDGIRVSVSNGDLLFMRWILHPPVFPGAQNLAENQIALIDRFRK